MTRDVHKIYYMYPKPPLNQLPLNQINIIYPRIVLFFFQSLLISINFTLSHSMMLGELKAIDGLIFKSYRRNGISPRPRARSGDDLLAEYRITTNKAIRAIYLQ